MTKTAADLPTPTSVPPAFPQRPDTLHKGQAGHVAIVAGSRGMSGAAGLCACGALRGGAGLVRAYCAKSIQPLVAASEPSLLTAELPETDDEVLDGDAALDRIPADWPHVLAVGPGLGQAPGLQHLLTGLLEREPRVPLVIDADGLNNLAATTTSGEEARTLWGTRAGSDTVITPHPGEMVRLREAARLAPLAGDDDATRLRIACEYAVLSGVTVVLKGHRTVVCTADAAFINTTGNPGMASGGMGDVLTGLIAALIAQGLPVFDAACVGVHVHGLAADHCATEIGTVGFLARDVAEGIPAALAEVARPQIGFHTG